MPAKKFDLIVFGASSFVGEILTRYLAETFGLDGELNWAIAGRSEQKLQKVRGTLAPILGDKAKDVEILLADAADENQLQELTSRTKVIVSTVGPYALYGEPLVKAPASYIAVALILCLRIWAFISCNNKQSRNLAAWLNASRCVLKRRKVACLAVPSPVSSI